MAELSRKGWLVSVQLGVLYQYYLVGYPAAETAKNAVRIFIGPGIGNRKVTAERELKKEEIEGHRLRFRRVVKFGEPKPSANP